MSNNMKRFGEDFDHVWKSDAEKDLETYHENNHPTDDLPDFIMKLNKEGAENLQAPNQFVFQAIAMTVFASLQGKLFVETPDGRLEKCVGYMVAVGPSASGKSRTSRKYLEPFRKFEQKLKDKYKVNYKDYLNNLGLWKLKLKKLDKKIEKCSDPDECIELEMQRHELYGNMPSEVCSVNLIFDRATPMALVSVASKSNLPMLYVNDEGYSFYNGAMGKQHDILNNINDGADYNQVSLERRAESCKETTLNISIYIQNKYFAAVRNKSGEVLKSSGADSRCLYTYTNTVGGFNRVAQSVHNWCYFEEYERRIEKITLRFNCCENIVMTLSEDAKRKYIEFYETCIDEVEQSKIAAHMPEYMIRSVSNLIKVAGMLAILENPEEKIISGSIMSSAESIINYHTQVYDRILRSELFYNRKGIEEEALELLEKIKLWHHNRKFLNRTELMQQGPSRLRKKHRLDMALKILLAQDRISIAINGRVYYRFNNDSSEFLPGHF